MATVPAILGTARLGNFRLGYQPAALATVRATRVRITIGGTAVTARVRRRNLMIRNVLNDEPDTCTLVIEGTAPTVDQVIRVTINSTTPRLLFNGTVQTVDLSYEGKPGQVAYAVTAIDDTARANARLPFGSWTAISATTVAQELVATFAPGFTATHVELGLPLISVNFDGTEGMNGAMRQIAKLIGGYFYWEDFDLHLFQTEATDAPATITGAAGQLLDTPAIRLLQETSQIRTRNYGIGRGTTALEPVAIGATTLPLESTEMFNASGGRVITGTQILTYTGFTNLSELRVGEWTTNNLPAGNAGLALAWAPSLGLFVSVHGIRTATSPDGITWTAHTAPGNGANAVTWAASISLFCGVQTNQVVTSPDGVTWTSRTAAAAWGWGAVAWSPSLGLFAAVASNGGTTAAMTSPDGITWTSRTTPTGIWQGLTWAPGLGLFVAVGGIGAFAFRVMTSPDGIVWTGRTASLDLTAVAWSPSLNLLAAVGDTGVVMTSPDGITWTSRTPSAANQWTAITWAPEVALFLAVSGNGEGRVMTSTDGQTWLDRAMAVEKVWRAVVWAPTLGIFVVTGGPSSGGTALVSVVTPRLGGIPALGTGAITRVINVSDPVNLFIQRDDLTAQAEYAARASTADHPHDGIVEHLITDKRRNEPSLTALCDADLDLFSRPIKTVPYACRDVGTKAGKPITFAISSPAIAETLTIQEVTITEIDVSPGLAPRFTATASSVRFSLEDLLRRMNAFIES